MLFRPLSDNYISWSDTFIMCLNYRLYYVSESQTHKITCCQNHFTAARILLSLRFILEFVEENTSQRKEQSDYYISINTRCVR